MPHTLGPPVGGPNVNASGFFFLPLYDGTPTFFTVSTGTNHISDLQSILGVAKVTDNTAPPKGIGVCNMSFIFGGGKVHWKNRTPMQSACSSTSTHFITTLTNLTKPIHFITTLTNLTKPDK